MNGSKHLIAVYSLLASLAISAIGGGFWAGGVANAQEDQKRQGERRDKMYGQMDHRQRTLEQSAATIRERLKAIDEIKEAQKEILKALRQR